MSGGMASEQRGYSEGNGCSLEVVSSGGKKGNLFFLDG